MKRTVKLLSGLALVAAIVIVSLSSFDAPVTESDCGCPPEWELRPTAHDNNLEQWDTNNDGLLCRKIIPGENAKGNNKGTGTKKPKNWKDNNQPCKD